MVQENEAYVLLLRDSLKKKKEILGYLLACTKKQHEILTKNPVDYDAFEQLLKDKETKIHELTQIDEGFDLVFEKVKVEVNVNKEKYKDIIIQMQKDIRDCGTLGLEVQTLEGKNSEQFKLYLVKEKSQIKESQKSSQMVTSYYQSMAGKPGAQEAVFFNKTK